MSDKQTFIYIFFQDTVEEGTSEPVCGYWDAAQSKWVCFEPKVRREDRIECEADHLTNFAALFVTGVRFIKFLHKLTCVQTHEKIEVLPAFR